MFQDLLLISIHGFCIRRVAAKGDGAPECDKFAKYYRSLCPGEWVCTFLVTTSVGTEMSKIPCNKASFGPCYIISLFAWWHWARKHLVPWKLLRSIWHKLERCLNFRCLKNFNDGKMVESCESDWIYILFDIMYAGWQMERAKGEWHFSRSFVEESVADHFEVLFLIKLRCI